MAKLIMLSGLPASGKSTRAKELVEASGNAVRLNRDLLRTMLHFDKWTGRNEGMTVDAEKVLALHFLKAGKNVIIDDTNLTPFHLDLWRGVAKDVAKFEHVRIDTPIGECLVREASRDRRVGQHVIYRMAMSNGFVEAPPGGYVLCDLDGTLAKIDHRLHHVQGDPKDWKSFFAEIPGDEINAELAETLREYGPDRTVLVSARPERCRADTEAWLERHGVRYLTLLMRRDGDHRPDTEVKEEILLGVIGVGNVALVYDDRPSVIRMWRSHGIRVVDCGTGVEF